MPCTARALTAGKPTCSRSSTTTPVPWSVTGGLRRGHRPTGRPPVHTIYMDRPMKGAILMQALARVNRRFRAAAVTRGDTRVVGHSGRSSVLNNTLCESCADTVRRTGMLP